MEDIGNIQPLVTLLGRAQDLDTLLAQASTSYLTLQARLQALRSLVQDTTNNGAISQLPVLSLNNYLWRLALAETAPKFVCKERSFRLYFTLQRLGNVELERDQEILPKIKVWNGSMTRVLETNLANLPIVVVKASKTRYLASKKVHNLAIRLKLNEVSSHFEAGVFTLEIEAQLPLQPDYESRVKSCVIRNLVVRAKAATCVKDLKREGKKHRTFDCF